MSDNDASSVATILRQALALHQSGQFKQAEALYQQVLSRQPQHFDALHLSGVLARQNGDVERAIYLIEQAIRIDPGQAAAYCNLGAALQDANRPVDALRHYDRALQIRPDYALALNNRGNALRKLQRFEEALESYRRALQLVPAYVEAFYNCGIVLHKLLRHAEAVDCYERAVQLKPEYADAWCNRGMALQELGSYMEALQSYRQALDIDVKHADAWYGYGTALQKLQHFEQAVHAYDQAVQWRPSFADAHLYRGNALRALVRHTEAITAYRCALQHGGDPETIAFALAALGEGPVPVTAPAAYVKNLFDQYAEHFDRHLLDVLHYQTPALLLQAVRDVGMPNPCDCIDLGCGTGLCGPLLRPFVHRLNGIDLSPNMLEKASQRAIYDELDCVELSAFLQQKSACFDLVFAADVLVYFGDLCGLFSNVRQALREGGAFAFSVEESSEHDFTLCQSNRYAHSAAYIEALAGRYGFSVQKMEKQILRHDAGLAIQGLLVVLICVKSQ